MRKMFLKIGDNFAYAILVIAIAAIAFFMVAVLISILRWVAVPVLLIAGAVIWLSIRNNPIEKNREIR